MVDGEREVGIELSPRGTNSQLHRVQAVQIPGGTNLCNCKNGKLPKLRNEIYPECCEFQRQQDAVALRNRCAAAVFGALL